MDSRGAGGNIDRPLKPIPAVRPKLDLVLLCRIGPFWFHIADLTEKGKAMRDDLLDAVACVDWTKAQLPSLGERIDAWLKLNLYAEVVDHDPDCPNNVIVCRQKEPLPLFFNVEVGAYLNVLRSSLDILATVVARRHPGVANPEKVYFPIAASRTEFFKPETKGAKFIQALPSDVREIFETLEPYKGGNEELWALHQLDIMRKHRKLLTVITDNRYFQISGAGVLRDYKSLSTGFMVVNDQESVVGLIRKGAPNYEMQFTGEVAINETDLMPRKAVISALDDFASFAKSVIGLFDIS